MTDDISQSINDLSADDLATRRSAADRLSRMGEDARAAAVSLVRCAGDSDEEVRESVIAALEELGSPHASDQAAISELLAAENADTAYWAATLLGRLSSAAEPSVERLAGALSNHPELQVRQRAAWALGKFGPAAAAAKVALEAASRDEDPRLARLAQRALEQIAGD